MTLADDLRAGGLRVVEVGDWQHRQRPGDFLPVGNGLHHTAGSKSLPIIVNGRPDLAGPLANLHFPKDGTVNLVSGGRTNHFGAGAQAVLDRTRANLAPLGDARTLGYTDGPTGNGYFYGLEVENLGDGHDPYPEVQLNAVALTSALLCRKHRWGWQRCVAHREWSRRKPDPTFDVRNMRTRVEWLLAAWGDAPTVPPPVVVPAPTLDYWTNEDGELMATTYLQVPLDDKGRAQHSTGLAYGKFVGAVPEAGVVPNTNGWYPGDPGHERQVPRVWPADDKGTLQLVCTGGTPGFPMGVWLTTRP